jgi:hypothetical protein
MERTFRNFEERYTKSKYNNEIPEIFRCPHRSLQKIVREEPSSSSLEFKIVRLDLPNLRLFARTCIPWFPTVVLVTAGHTQ